MARCRCGAVGVASRSNWWRSITPHPRAIRVSRPCRLEWDDRSRDRQLAPRHGRPDDAIPWFERALRVEPRNADAWLFPRDDPRRSRRDRSGGQCVPSRQRRPSDKPLYRHNLVIALEKLGRYEETLPEYEILCRIEPDDMPNWGGRTLALTRPVAPHAARSLLRDWLTRNPSHPGRGDVERCVAGTRRHARGTTLGPVSRHGFCSESRVTTKQVCERTSRTRVRRAIRRRADSGRLLPERRAPGEIRPLRSRSANARGVRGDARQCGFAAFRASDLWTAINVGLNEVDLDRDGSTAIRYRVRFREVEPVRGRAVRHPRRAARGSDGCSA